MPLPKSSLKINEGIAQAINIDCRGLIYHTPTGEESLQTNQARSVYLYIQKGGLDKSSPYRRTIPSTEEESVQINKTQT